MALRTLSVFAGIGWLDRGFSLGLRAMGFDSRTVCYIERDSYAAACLVARMEDTALDSAPVWDDLTTFDGLPWRDKVDCLIGGPPCQPYSCAGKQLGHDDERSHGAEGQGPLEHLVRVIGEVQPSLVLLENVPAWVRGGWFRRFGEAVHGLGFRWSPPLFISAADVGAPHKRERVFLLAESAERRFRELWQPSRGNGQFDGGDGALAHTEYRRSANKKQGSEPGVESSGLANTSRLRGKQRAGRKRVFDNGSGVGHAERIGSGEQEPGRGSNRRATVGRAGESVDDASSLSSGRDGGTIFGTEAQGGCDRFSDGDLPERYWIAGGEMGDTSGTRRQERRSERSDVGAKLTTLERAGCELFPPGPGDFDGWRRVVADGSGDFRAPAVKPGVCVLADGITMVVDASRADQLRCAGNGVVQLQAAYATAILVGDLALPADPVTEPKE